jgi:uncharacterized protein involved in exopolysaccharide biosynthesis
LWVTSAIACTFLAAAYALIAPREWRASQALIIRPEAASVSDNTLGKFSDLSEMKTHQETVLELAKSYGVIEATLRRVGPSDGRAVAGDWPTARDVEDFREQIDMRPPGGAEFGKTEVFYLTVVDSDRLWSAAALRALYNELEERLQQLRNDRAASMIAELQRAVELSENDLTQHATRLAAFEAAIGADIGELRNLNATVGGQGEVSQELLAVEGERRANEALRRENVRLLALLEKAQDDPDHLLATPNSLLRSQPPLNQLKIAVVDAQVRTSGLLGTRSEKHPLVIAARNAEASMRGQLHKEIAVAIRGLQVELALNADTEKALLAKWREARERLSRLAGERAEYATLLAAAEDHTKLVEGARKNLADARARQAAAHSASVISRIDGVEAGVRPIGPSRITIAAAGGVGGLIFGVGLVFLLATRPSDTSLSASANVVPDAEISARTTANETGCFRPRHNDPFGLFRGMTLEEAVRSVRQQ